MSKQSRKKSPKTSPADKSAGKSGARAKAPAKAAKTSAAPARKTAKKAVKKAVSKGSKASTKPGTAKPAAARRPAAKSAKSPSSAATGRESAPRPAALAEGAKAPGFSLPRDGGGTVSLADYAGQKLVLFFYPKANTPGCTKEAIDFTRLAAAFADAGAAVLGVSADTVKAQDNFRDKHGLAVPLVSDEHHEMLEAYGAWGEKSLYGRKFLGIIRSTVLIDHDGRIAKVWRNVKVDGHADAVLAAAQGL
ncbi:peroxiredoxin [Bradyrhizobium sp. HKCCYLS1011]|uniref:peroxiredoxin n=1 Tax=Bradyrhizobium sp. HKCCYLS1011 TaxID=3420733 RepID=UPI003EBAFBF4